MLKFLSNLFALTRPLSNTKNVLIVCLAFFLSGTRMNWINFILGIISLSFVCSAVYAFNTFCDFKIDKENKNKEHYSRSVSYWGERRVGLIIAILTILGLSIGLMINYYFLLCLILLIFFNFLYSFPRARFKEKMILDVLTVGVIVFVIRFVAAWFLFKISIPPALPILVLIFAKSGGYMLDKEMDRNLLLEKNIKNSITVISKTTNIIISTILLVLSIIFTSLMCLNARYFQMDFMGYLPENILFLFPFVVPPLVIMYLKVANKINTKRKYLRIIGFLYALLVLGLVFIIL